MRRTAGMLMYELAGVLAGVAIMGILVVAASAGVQRLHMVESASAQSEEAQNLLADWRAGRLVAAPGWTATVRRSGSCEILDLSGHGVRLQTLRPVPAVAP